MAIMSRYGAIPGHVLTAIFASTGMGVVSFLISAFASLPKQLAAVYLGSTEHSVDGDSSSVSYSGTSKKTRIIKLLVVLVVVVFSIFTMKYVDKQIDQIKDRVIYPRRKRPAQATLSGSLLPYTRTGLFRPARSRREFGA
ncbi:hypothetical protein C8Q80DRAFT_1120285 [Daedaleopsis nitida]|nr:hypothetical protein C8Q80DRAFT_1120285 [Daedaleopsis nitida]